MLELDRRTLLQAAAAAGAATFMGMPLSALAQAARGGVLVIGTTQRPRHLNPAVQSGLATMAPGAQIFASPMTIDEKWNPQPYLAERWVLSDDRRSVTLHLRRDAKFHDGKPITSEDVRFSVEAVRDNHPFKTMFGPVNGITLPDAHTAVIRLSEPHPALLLAMTTSFLPILPKHIYGDGQPLATHPRNSTNVVGSGPFKVTEFKPGEHLILERFEGHWAKDRPLLDRIILREFRDSASQLLAFERGEIDVHQGMLDPRDIERAKKVAGAQILPSTGSGFGMINWLAFNTRHPQLADKRVRQAIHYAIDKKLILETLLGGVHRRATGPITASSPFYNAKVEAYDFNPQKAVALLDAAGLKPGANGVRLSLQVDAIPGVPDHKVIQEYLKPALAKVGIEANTRVSPDFPTWARRISTFQFDMTMDSVWNWGDPVIGVHRTWLTSNIREGVIWSNTQSYSNPKVDALLAAAGKEMDAARRKASYLEFQKLVVDDAPVAFIHEWTSYVAYQSRVVNPPNGVWGQVAPFEDVGLRKA